MDKRAERLRKIITLAVLEERNVCLELKKAQRQLDTAADRLEELATHQRRYRSTPLPNGSVGAMRWHDYQRFLARLSEAIRVQTEQVRNGEQLLAGHRRRWREKRKRVETLEQIRERYLKAESERDDTQMQKTLDDLKPMEDIFDG
jgi:flagellar FliJ protein